MNDDKQENEALKSSKEIAKRESKKMKRKIIINMVKKAAIPLLLLFAKIMAVGLIFLILFSVFSWLIDGENPIKKRYEEQLQEQTRISNLQTYLRQFSHSTEAPQSEDGKFYKLYGDGAGYPTIGNADLQWESHQTEFACEGKVRKGTEEQTVNNVQEWVNSFLTKDNPAGYTNEEIDNLDIYIEKELVDSIGEQAVEKFYQNVLAETSGLDLDEQQLYALTAIAYNFGHLPTRNGYTFTKVYNEGAGLYAINSWEHNRYIWDNWWCYLGGGSSIHIPARDAQFETYVKGVYDFSQSNAGEISNRAYYIYYTQEQVDKFNNAPANIKTTRTSSNEQEIFTYNKNDSAYMGYSFNSSNIVENAVECHRYLRENGYTYAQVGLSIPKGVLDGKTIDCSSYVSWVLYCSGYEDLFQGHQKTSYTFDNYKNNELASYFIEISKEEALPGDVLVYDGHVEIVAKPLEGADKFIVYNCGSNYSIQAEGYNGIPETVRASRTTNKITKILRIK